MPQDIHPTLVIASYAGEGELEFLAPDARALNASDNNGTVLVNNADLRPVAAPLHVPHNTLVAVVDHLLSPVPLVVSVQMRLVNRN